MSTDTCYTILTASVPRYACWPVGVPRYWSASLLPLLPLPLTLSSILLFQQLECDVALSKEAQHLAQVH